MARLWDGVGYSDCNGGPPPRLVIAPQLLCSAMALALRSTWHPLTNHPNEPLGISGARSDKGVFTGGGVWLGEAAAWGDPLVDPTPKDGLPEFGVGTSRAFSQRKGG